MLLKHGMKVIMTEYESTLIQFQALVDKRELALIEKQKKTNSKILNNKTITKGYKDFINKTQKLEKKEVHPKTNQKQGGHKP